MEQNIDGGLQGYGSGKNPTRNLASRFEIELTGPEVKFKRLLVLIFLFV